MPSNSAQQRQTWPEHVGAVAALAAQLLGLVVFAGWWLGIARVVQPIPGMPEMVQDTALCFVLLGTSLLLLRRSYTRRPWRRLAQIFALVAVAIAILTLIEYAVGVDFGIDRTYVSSPLQAAPGFPVTRSGLGSAAAFLLIGLALLTLDTRRAVRTDLSEVLGVGAALVALTSAAGYLYGATFLYETDIPGKGMAVHTVIGMLMLSAGVICVRPNRPLMALVTSNQVGGFVVRRLLVGAFSIPVLGLLITVGLRRSLYDEPYAAALLAVTAMAIAVVLVLATGKALNRIDTARTTSERAVAEREERLRDLIQQASDGVFLADLDGRYTEVNDAGCKMLGYRREDLVGKTIMDLLPAADLPRLNASKDALLRGDPQVDEWTLLRRDGTRLPVEVSAKILPDGRWQGLVRDISARKTVERAGDAVAEAVTKSPQSSLRAVLETITMQAKTVADAEYAAFGFGGDSEHSFDEWIFVGLPPDEASKLGPPPRRVGLLDLVRDHSIRIANVPNHPSFRGFPAVHPPMTSFLGVPIRRHGRAVGNLYLANKRGRAEFTVADEQAVERLAARAGTAIETARLYQAERLERAWLAAVIDQMPEGVVLTNAMGTTLENRSMQAFARHDTPGDPRHPAVRYDLRLPDGRPVAQGDQPQTRALATGAPTISQEFSLRHPDGRLLPMLVSAAPVFDEQGNRSGAVTIYQDISTLKELERMREEWSSVVAHDLRQPVGIIAFEADRLGRMFDSGRLAEGSKVTERIRRSTSRLNTMINDLLDVSRLEARRLSLERTKTDLASLIEDAVDRLSSLVPGRRIRLRVDVRPAPAWVDAARFEQVLGNLISNAGKYGQPEGEIAIELATQGSQFKVSVVNAGSGIPAEEIPALFERFARSKTTRGSSVPGLGLGLYICKGLIEAHGGRIWAESIPGEKTTFSFTVPMLPQAAQAAA
jgi:PAS domain S-box-containing protein